MKKYTVSLLIVSLLLSLAGCGRHAGGQTSAPEVSASTAAVSSAAASIPASSSAAQDPASAAEQTAILKELSKVLETDCSAGTVTKSSDTHEKKEGDGLTFYSVHFTDEQLAKSIADGNVWHPLPLSEPLTALAYGIELTEDEEDIDWDDLDNDADYDETETDDSFDPTSEDSDDGDDEEEPEENGDLVFEEDEDMAIEPPVFEETPDADDLEDGVKPVIVGENGEEPDVEYIETIGPFLVNRNNEPLIPEVKNGFYYFQDRHPDSPDPESDEEILNRDSMHVTLAVYDTDTHTLYYCAFDDTLED